MHIGAKAQDNNEKLNLVTTANEYQQKRRKLMFFKWNQIAYLMMFDDSM